MPFSTQPVLSLAFNNINKIDRVDCDQLSSLWTVFTKCAESLENGRRLENLSWRLWYRECQLNDRDMQESQRRSAEQGTRPSLTRGRTCSSSLVPQLSTSIDSATTVDERDVLACGSPEERLKLQQHLTPDRFHQLVSQFGQEPSNEEWKERMDKSDTPLPTFNNEPESRSVPVPESQSQQSSNKSPEQVDYLSIKVRNAPLLLGPEDSSSALRRASSVVHGFHPSLVSVKKPLNGSCPSPRLTDGSGLKGKQQMFFIDSSPSGSDVECDARGTKRSKKKKASARSPAHIASTPEVAPPKKQRSFKEIVAQGSGYDSSPFDSDEDSDAPSRAQWRPAMDSAIMSDEESDEPGQEDDDDWASVVTESRANSFSEGNDMFNKMQTLPDRRPSLASRKSLLSTLFTDPTVKLSNAQSRSSPAIAQSRRPSAASSPPSTASKQGGRIAGSNLLLTADTLMTPATATATDIKGSVSPRTTRRNMLATELSESLRKHLLWERRQKPTNANNAAQAVLKRRHTAYDMTQLSDFPTGQPDGQRTPKPSVSVATEAGADDFGYNGCGW